MMSRLPDKIKKKKKKKKKKIFLPQLWPFENLANIKFNKQDTMAIYCYAQAVGGIVFYKHQL